MISTFLDMLEHGFYPNEYCFASVIRACSNARNIGIGKIIFGSVIKGGFLGSDVCVGCSLIDMFAKGGGDLGEAYKVFAQMGFPREAIGLYVDMLLSGFMPDQFALSGVISACTKLESLSLGQQLHSWVIRSGLALGHCVGCCLVDMYAKCAADGSMNDARKVFGRMPNHNVMSWTAIVNGYVQSGKGDEEAIKLFVEMMSGHVPP
ncbi:hypothetical protein ACFX14_011828 [Malus domestica]